MTIEEHKKPDVAEWLDREEGAPGDAWNRKAAQKSLDELYVAAQRYSSSEQYWELLRFVAQFKTYAPFNAMLVHAQKPWSRYVLSASRWLSQYGRRVKASAQPLVILQPMGPVMFVFDVSDTEGPPLPRDVENPFHSTGANVAGHRSMLITNCARDGIRVALAPLGSQQAGSLSPVLVSSREGRRPIIAFRDRTVPVDYELVLNQNLDKQAQFVTLTHELGHLYCGHFGTRDPEWWPDRRGMPGEAEEFEAESVSYLVCERLGVQIGSETYLHGYLKANKQIPRISIDRVFVVAKLLLDMCGHAMPHRKSVG